MPLPFSPEPDVAEPAMESVTLPVVGMTCAACQHYVEEALRTTAGVSDVRVDLMAHRARVVFDPTVAPPEKLIAAIRQAGYDAVLPRPGAAAAARETETAAARKAWVMIVAGAVAMLLAMPLGGQMGAIDRALMQVLPWLYATPPSLLRWSLFVLAAVLAPWAGAGIFLNAFRGLRHGTTNMNTLVSLGTGIAFLYSAYATFAPAPGRQVYYDAVLLILGFLLLGKALEGRAKHRALAALDSLSRMKPVSARRVIDGVETLVPLDEIRPGDSVLVLPGERFPVDAVVLEGRTTVDESMLTGESMPLAARTGRARPCRLAQLRWRRHLPRRIAGRIHRAGANHAHGGAGAELARAHGAAGRSRQRHLRPRCSGARGGHISHLDSRGPLACSLPWQTP